MEFKFMLKDGLLRIDGEDLGLLERFWWRSVRTGQGIYACSWIAGQTVYMHRLLLRQGATGKGGGDVDHINGDGLDNRRANLRLATRQQNSVNTDSRRGTSLFKGVSWNKRVGKWQAHVMVDYKSYGLGVYEAEEDAARAYDIAARNAFGEFARLNFPDRIGEPPPTKFTAKAVMRDLVAPTATPVDLGTSQGSRNPKAKLTEDDVRAIIRELQATPRRPQVSIAAQFGVTQATISRIQRREGWAHLWDGP